MISWGQNQKQKTKGEENNNKKEKYPRLTATCYYDNKSWK